MGEQLQNPSIMDIWVPDGYKDTPAERLEPRKRLISSLDAILSAMDGKHHKVAVEGKLFGIGAESCTVGSNEFYMAYAATRKTLLCLDAGHFHPTENVADKISTCLCFLDEILLHVSRPVRWDSDHVVLFDDATVAIAQEIVRSNGLNRVNVGLDYFDASINRVAAWVIGTRNFRKALSVRNAGAARCAQEGGVPFRLHGAAGANGRSQVVTVDCRVGILLHNQERSAGSEWLKTVGSTSLTC